MPQEVSGNSSGKFDSETVVSESKEASKIPWPRKLVYGCVFGAFVICLLEITLLVCGVRSIAEDSDPLQGFSSRYQLYRPSVKDANVLTTVPQRLGHFNPQSFTAQKEPNAFRIFTLGGSTTYGRPYDDQTSFSGFLRAALPEMDPSRKWEVINAGGISYASPRIAILMQELSQYQPDLFIIYTGHNEFLEDQTYSSLTEIPEALRVSAGVASHLRIYSVLHRVFHADEQPSAIDDSMDLSEVNTRLDRSIGPNAYHRDKPWQKQIITQFHENLETIVTLATKCGAQILLVTPASNLRDFKPFKSENNHDLHGEELKYFRQFVVEANTHYEEGSFALALQSAQKALEIDDLHAGAQFLRGEILLSLDRVREAQEAFNLALEKDVCPLRANRDIVKTIHDVADEHEVPLLDFSEKIISLSENQIPGEDWFLDHVHPTIAGNRLLAQMICEKMIQIDIVNPRTGWNDSEYEKVALNLVSKIDPHQHAMALRNLAKVLGWAGKNQEAANLVARAIKLLPNDAETHTMAGTAAMQNNQIDSARTHFEMALEIDPANARALIGLGDVLSREGNHEIALKHFSKATEIDPSLVPAWFNMGNSFRHLGQFNDALDAYRKALELEPNQPDAQKNLGLTLVMQGKIAEAVSHFETALLLDPDSAERHADLGLVLIDAGNSKRASAEFQTALTIDPNTVPALIGTALLSEQAGNLSQAADSLRKALTIDPENTNVRSFLERITN